MSAIFAADRDSGIVRNALGVSAVSWWGAGDDMYGNTRGNIILPIETPVDPLSCIAQTYQCGMLITLAI